ncbi:MAG: hypothetical protein ACLFQA_02900 [Bacteroidales bacterium]
MRKILFFLALLTMVVLSCKEEKPAEIRLCSDIRPANPCIGEDSVFIQGKNVWAQLWLGRNFDDTAVIANLYGYQDGQRIFIESIEHEIDQGQEVVMESLFFNNKGKFEVEFRGSKGNLLDKKGFEIW